MDDNSRPYKSTIQQRFEIFDATYPEVYTAFKYAALALHARGVRRYSADAILHHIRFESVIESWDSAGFRLNDHYSSRYARKLAADYPKLRNFFEMRRLRRL
jgi:hypothetical protein